MARSHHREEIFQVHPEKTPENQGVESEREQASIFHWLRERGFMIYMAATLSAGIPFKHERMEAAEISPTATWSEGIKTLQNNAMSDATETAATFYLDTAAQREKWIFNKVGEVAGVTYTGSDIAAAVAQELVVRSASSIALCNLHTHPLSAGESVSFISPEQRRNINEGKYSVSFPPSGYSAGGDISLLYFAKMQNELSKFSERGIAIDVRSGVVDPAGITYHRPADDKDLKREFPHYFAEVKQRRAIYEKWSKAINPLVDNIDAATLDRLHRLTENGGKLDQEEYAQNFPAKAVAEFKRTDIKIALIQGSQGSEEIARILIADNARMLKLYDEVANVVRGGANRDMGTLDQARTDWIKTSMQVPARELSHTKQYAELREAFARNATYIRFVPYEEVPNEPPCAGTDYKR